MPLILYKLVGNGQMFLAYQILVTFTVILESLWFLRLTETFQVILQNVNSKTQGSSTNIKCHVHVNLQVH
jgi:hypothetical protein